MAERSSSEGRGLGFFGVLAVVLVVLKLCGVVHWGWVWVLAPIWAPFALVAAAAAVAGAGAVLVRRPGGGRR